MTTHHPSPRRPVRRGWLAAVTVGALAAPLFGGGPAAAAGPFWEVRWSAPVTTAGPNPFVAPPELRGTAAPPVVGNPTGVTYAVAVPDGYPAACAVPGGAASLAGRAFTVKPVVPCNGSYRVSVVATGNTVPRTSPKLEAPISLADPGPAPAGVRGSVVERRVTISWNRDADPDVVGYRIRRDGRPIADVGRDAGSFTDSVPAAGRYGYDVQGLRWGAGGPGSPSLASPPSPAVVAPVVDGAPPVTVGPDPGSTGGGALPSDPDAASPTAARPDAAPAAGKGPTRGTGAGPTSGGSRSRTSYRSGGTISPRSGGSAAAAEPDTYAERLPYQPRTTEREVEVASPATARTVARTVSTPRPTGPRVLVPFAVVTVFLAGSVQIRSFLRRTAASAHPLVVEVATSETA